MLLVGNRPEHALDELRHSLLGECRSQFFTDVAFASDMEQSPDIGDGVGKELERGLAYRVEVVGYAAAVGKGVVDAQGEVQEVEVAPVLAYVYVVNPRIRELAAGVLRAVPKAHINAVVVFGFLLFFPCFESGKRVRGGVNWPVRNYEIFRFND